VRECVYKREVAEERQHKAECIFQKVTKRDYSKQNLTPTKVRHPFLQSMPNLVVLEVDVWAVFIMLSSKPLV